MPSSAPPTRSRIVALIALLATVAVGIWFITIRAIRSMPGGTTVIALPGEESAQPAGKSTETTAAPGTAEGARKRLAVSPAAAPAPAPAEASTDNPPSVPAVAPNTTAAPAAGISISETVRVDADARIYNSNDLDVQPPVVIGLNALGVLPNSGNRDNNAMIEIVVNGLGEVESVRAVDVPQDLGDAVVITSSLSAAKSWHFRPAMKDGHPVRYRHRMFVTLR